MRYIITEKCCECGSCAHFCKQGGIAYDYALRIYVIDQEHCDGCGTCIEYCPIDDAIIAVEDCKNKVTV